jgi:hypothetical protein
VILTLYSIDQKEYLDAGVDRCVSSLLFLSQVLMSFYSVLTKPVLERNLRDILVLADGRRKRAGDSSAPNRA